MTIGIIAWENPGPPALPPSQRKTTLRNGMEKVAQQLMANPGQWAKVAENDRTNVGVRLREVHGMEVAYRSAGRGYEQGLTDIYARYPQDKAA